MKKIHNLKLFGLVAFLAFALVFIGIDSIEGQKKKPPGQDKKGDDAFQDMPLCIDFDDHGSGEFWYLDANVDSLCDSVSGVTAFAGRRWGIALEIHKNTSDPYLVLFLDPLDWATGDPDPANDGGYYDGDGQATCPPPSLDITGRIFGPQFVVGEGLELVNIKDMEVGIEYAEWTVARLIFKDDKGDEYHLFWGSGRMPGNIQRTNPLAPDVYVVRNDDIIIDSDSQSNWDVTTTEDAGDRIGVHTAFLWLLSKPWTFDYCGAYNVSFSYTAIEE